MRFLLDTHYVIWLMLDDSSLSTAERRVLGGPRDTLVVSAVAIWEARLKRARYHVSGKPKGIVKPDDMIGFVEGLGIPLLSVMPRHAAATLSHPAPNKDPFDEMLLVQAQEEGLRLLTRDGALRDHPLVFQP